MHRLFLNFFNRTASRIKHCFNDTFTVIAMLVLLSVTGCSNVIQGALISNSQDDEVSIVITNYSQNSNVSVAKTVAPSTYLLEDVKKFIIEGENYDGDFYSNSIAIANDGTGTIVGLKPSVWNFVLHAYSDAAGTTEVLRGYATVDTSYITTVAFVLTSAGVSTQGSCSLTFKYNSDGAATFNQMASSVTGKICDSLTGHEIYSFFSTGDTTELAKWLGEGYTAQRNLMNPGSYILTVEFFYTENSVTKRSGFWSDLLVIEPGRQTTKTITIPNILSTKPAAPQNLTLHRIDSTLTADSYNAVIRWDDVSTNEEYFVLKLRSYASNTATTGTTTTLTGQYSEPTDGSKRFSSVTFAQDGVGYIGGSLWSGSEEYVLKLATGKLYDIELYSVNSFGSSSSVSRITSADIADDSDYGELTGFGATDSSPYTRVNTFVLSYNLADGTMLTGLGTAHEGQYYNEYHIYTGSATSLLTPAAIADPSDPTFASQNDWPVLYYSTLDQPWSKWFAYGDSTQIEITSVDSFVNRTFVAAYTMQNSSDVYIDNDSVHLTYGATAAGSAWGTGSNANGISILSSGTYITLTVDRSSLPNSQFEQFKFLLNGNVQSTVNVPTDGSAQSTYSYTVILPFKGTYTLQAAGIYNGQTFYSTEFTTTVSN